MKEKTVPVDRETLQDAIEDLSELRNERAWWNDEPRCGYDVRYRALSERIEKLKQLMA